MPACAAYGCTNRPTNKIPGITFHRFPKDIALRNKWILALRRANFRPSTSSILCSEHFSEDRIDRTSVACVRLRENAVPNIFKGYPKHLQKELERLSAAENKNVTSLKRKFIVVEEDEGSGNGDVHSQDAEQINSSGIFAKHESIASKSSNGTNEEGLSVHPNILKILPENVSKDAPSSKLSSSNDLNPDLIDSLTTSHQVENTVTPNSNITTSAIMTLTLSNSSTENNKVSNEVILQRKVQRLEIMSLGYQKKIKLLQQQSRRQKAKIEALKKQIKDLKTNQTTDDDVSEDCISENEIYEELLKHQMENEENSS